ncbi:MAG: hypothetical protein ACK5PB_01970 [Pirellula sp.]|jgi:hypothetical protein
MYASYASDTAPVTVFGWIMTQAFGGSSVMHKVTLWIVDEDITSPL